jgi:hypothetical protein
MRTLVVSLLLIFAAPAMAKDLVDINSASSDQLKALPGVDDALAGKIVAGRPYTGKDQLLKQKLVDADEYKKLRPLIVAKVPRAIGGQGSVEKHEGPGPATDPNLKK